jgi:hypothetical protein
VWLPRDFGWGRSVSATGASYITKICFSVEKSQEEIAARITMIVHYDNTPG